MLVCLGSLPIEIRHYLFRSIDPILKGGANPTEPMPVGRMPCAWEFLSTSSHSLYGYEYGRFPVLRNSRVKHPASGIVHCWIGGKFAKLSHDVDSDECRPPNM